ncbi:MAG: hypothetical protein OER21_14540 [Gemmatimonadota bacterium]|nr:hypothetical protein [Gemmatimonadota bacterium]
MRSAFAFTLIAVLLTAGCGDEPSGPGTTVTVEVRDNNFSPSSATLAAGGTATWNWTGGNLHDVTWTAGSPAASPTQTTGSYQRQFASAGTFEYYCTVHGTPTSGMRGSVTVQ